MKTIWLIWWLSWESTREYYRYINEMTREKLWWSSSAKIIMYSFNFQEITDLVYADKLDEVGKKLLDVAKQLENAWADVILICTNFMHRFFEMIQSQVKVPMIHIWRETGKEIAKKWLKKIWLMWARWTMQEGFYKKVLLDEFGVESILPSQIDQDWMHDCIFQRLCAGQFLPEDKKRLLNMIQDLASKWAEWVVLGCTELPLVIFQDDCDIPVFNTMEIHSRSAVEFSLR